MVDLYCVQLWLHFFSNFHLSLSKYDKFTLNVTLTDNLACLAMKLIKLPKWSPAPSQIYIIEAKVIFHIACTLVYRALFDIAGLCQYGSLWLSLEDQQLLIPRRWICKRWGKKSRHHDNRLLLLQSLARQVYFGLLYFSMYNRKRIVKKLWLASKISCGICVPVVYLTVLVFYIVKATRMLWHYLVAKWCGCLVLVNTSQNSF